MGQLKQAKVSLTDEEITTLVTTLDMQIARLRNSGESSPGVTQEIELAKAMREKLLRAK